MKKQSLIKGTFILGFAGVFSKFLGIFFRWPLIMLIGDEGVGYYQMSYPLYMFFVSIACGIPVAISKMVSEKNAIGDREGVSLVLRKAILVMVILGAGTTILLFSFSKQIINYLNWDQKAYYSLVSISIAPICISIMSVYRGFFQGLQNMTPTAISQVIEQIGRVLFGVGLALFLLPKGIEYSAGGAAFGAAAGGLLGGAYLFNKYLKVRKEYIVVKTRHDDSILNELLKIAVPISLGATVASVMNLIDSAIVPQKLLQAGYNYKEAAILYGQLTGKAAVLVNVPMTLSFALCASIVPIIAEAYVLNRRQDVIKKVEQIITFSMVIALPCFLGLFALASPIINLVFPGHGLGYNILKYLSFSIPFIIIVQSSTAILQGIGMYYKPVINLLIGCIVKVLITGVLVSVPEINIYGAVIGTVSGYVIASVLNMRLIRKKMNITIDYFQVLTKPVYAAIIMIIGVVIIYINVYNYTMSNTISTLTSIFFGMIIYTLLIIILGVFKYSYIKNKFTSIQKGRK